MIFGNQQMIAVHVQSAYKSSMKIISRKLLKRLALPRIYDFVKLMDLRRGLVIFVDIQRGVRGEGEGWNTNH